MEIIISGKHRFAIDWLSSYCYSRKILGALASGYKKTPLRRFQTFARVYWCGLRLTINIAAVTNGIDGYQHFRVVNGIEHTVITDAKAVSFFTLEFFSTKRTRVVLKR
jgi:hypothetical protein